jgi:glucokinase
MKNKYYFGVDLGGTVTKIGLVNKELNVFDKRIFSTFLYDSKSKLLRQIIKNINDILQKDKRRKRYIAGIGLGVPGLVNFEEGLIYKLTNIPGWRDVEITKILKRETGLPILVDNDVNAITLGEFIFGAGKGTKNMICLTLGTGVGGGIILEGKLYRGSSYSAGEIGHFPIKRNGLRCNCGSRGCLERYIGNKYFTHRVIKKIKATGEGTKILKLVEGDFSKITPKIIAEAAKEGDELAKEAWCEFAWDLGLVLAGLINFFNPDTIVIGGGMSEAGRPLFEPLKKIVRKFTLNIPQGAVRIRKAHLRDESGIIGAASLFFS